MEPTPKNEESVSVRIEPAPEMAYADGYRAAIHDILFFVMIGVIAVSLARGFQE